MHTLPNSNDTHSIRLRGFAGIKPDPIPVNYYGFDTSSSIDAKYKLLILQNMPYRYFITFTFARYMNYQTSLEHISRLLRWANNKIFGREYNKKHNFIDGFAFVEKHMSGKSINDNHVHLLVKAHYRYSVLTQAELTDIFRKCAAKIVDGKDKKVFGSHCVHMETVRDVGAALYCLKQINLSNLDRIKFLCVHGLSDTL